MSYEPGDAKSIFLQAIDLPSEAERLSFVEQACSGRPELKARVEALLKTAADPDSLLDRPLPDLGVTQLEPNEPQNVSLDFLEPCEVDGALGRLAGYVVLELIGRGGMGMVLRATDPKLNRIVAIKVLAPEFAGNPTARRRFLREAKAAAAVSHDHIVTIHAVDDDQKLPFIVMECIVGQSLQQKIDKVGALGLKETLRIGMQMASGLAAAHAQGLVHRDVKPANILLENGIERVKLSDFGLARMVDDASVTQSGVIAGTPQYMSPEQARGDTVDHRSDLFSLGCVMYAMCVGHAPFRASTTMGVLKRVCEDTPRPIRELNTETPDWLVAIISKLMAKSPDDRIQTAAELADLFRQCLAHVQQPNQAPLPEMIRSLKQSHQTATDGTRNSRSHRNSRHLAIGLAMVVFLIGLWVVLGGTTAESTRTVVPEDASSQRVASIPDEERQEKVAESNDANPVLPPGIWGNPSSKGMQLGIVLDQQPKSGYRLHDQMTAQLALRNAGQGVLSFAMPRTEILEKLGLELAASDGAGQKMAWNWGKSHKSRGELTVSGAFAGRLAPGQMQLLPAAKIRIGCGKASSEDLICLDVKPGQTCRLKFRLDSYSYARDEGEALESGAIELQVQESRPTKARPQNGKAPFDEEAAAALQQEWATYLNRTVEETDSIGLTLCLIPPGKFQMGSTAEEIEVLKKQLDERGASVFDRFVAESSAPRHVVELSEPFDLSKYEVTVAQFKAFVEQTGYIASAERKGTAKFTWKNFIPETDAKRQPVCGVSWDDAKAYCDWLGVKTSVAGVHFTYDLPTEAQWEYACRAGTQTLWSFGDDPRNLSEFAIAELKGASYPAAIGLRRSNAFGLHDMHGNVDEWCLDWHNRDYYGRAPLVDPVFLDAPQQEGSGRVARGGAWNADAWWSRSATRTYDFPTSPSFAKGFRVVRKVADPTQPK